MPSVCSNSMSATLCLLPNARNLLHKSTTALLIHKSAGAREHSTSKPFTTSKSRKQSNHVRCHDQQGNAPNTVQTHDPFSPTAFRVLEHLQPGKLSVKRRSEQLIKHRLGPLPSSAAALRSQLLRGQADAFTELVSRIKQGAADSETVRVCLIAAKRELFELPRTKCAATAQEGPPFASTVLGYIWKDAEL